MGGATPDRKSSGVGPIAPIANAESVPTLIRAAAHAALRGALRDHRFELATRTALKRIERALAANSPDIARRELDRLWRSQSADRAPALASLYGPLLILDDHDLAAAQRLLALATPKTPDLAALNAWSLSRQNRAAAAYSALQEALVDFAVTPEGLLAAVATAMLHGAPLGIGGWVARTPDLGVIGVLRADAPRQLQIHCAGAAPRTLPLDVDTNGGFALRASVVPALATLALATNGYRILGRCESPPDFGIDGRATTRGARVAGWIRFGWHPTATVAIRITDEHRRQRVLTARVSDASPEAAMFGIAWPRSVNRILIEAQDPLGRWHALPDAPLLRGRAIRGAGRSKALPTWRSRPVHKHGAAPRRAPPVDVIIPVYGGREATLACLASVRASLPPDVQLIVIDDATPDVALAEALTALGSKPQITLLRNATNLGFVASVNRALTVNPTHDAVLVNADTLVCGDWVTRLRAAAYSGPKVATVTPWTNDGTITSYPLLLNPGADVQALQQLCAETLDHQSLEILVGVGFCLYLRRDALCAVGPFDVESFGLGYGEETDFSLRARALGWTHRLAADVFVAHAAGRSFGARRLVRMERAGQVLDQRYPGFGRQYDEFLAADPLQPLRHRLDAARLRGLGAPVVLLVTHALEGGVARFVQERAAQLRAAGRTVLVLRPAIPGDSRVCMLSCESPLLAHLCFRLPSELKALTQLLRELPLEAIEIQHFLHHHARLIDALRELGVPYDVVVHDYAWVCPRITLIDGSGRYCGEPSMAVCKRCVRHNGSLLGDAISVGALRERSARWLAGARHVTAPSTDPAIRLARYFPGIRIGVTPHANGPQRARPEWPIDTTGLVRVAVLGAIGDHKGYEVLKACARDARARRLPLEFVVIGYTQDDAALSRLGAVFVTGRYQEGEAQSLLRRERPALAFLPSVWPETWSYTLDEALAAGLFVISFDLGAIAERVKAVGRGKCLPLASTPRTINDTLLAEGSRMRGRPVGQEEQMTQEQSDNPSPARKDAPTPVVRKDGLTASVQLLPLPPGLYLISVTANGASMVGAGGALPLPTLQVSAGPGVGPTQLEFLASGANESGWLFAPRDLLVVRVKTPGATLALTSVRDPAGEALAVKVERLDAGATAAPAIGAPAPALVVAADASLLPLQITAHVRSRGDLRFTDAPWAGRVAPGLWIESFALRPLAQLTAADVEYKGLTGNGFETPWITDEGECGTKGLAVPLVGFAVRLKGGNKATAAFDCEYSGYFKSGVTVGPLRNGAPCRSTVANDPLEGIQIRLRRRTGGRATAAAPAKVAAKGAAAAPTRAKRGR